MTRKRRNRHKMSPVLKGKANVPLAVCEADKSLSRFGRRDAMRLTMLLSAAVLASCTQTAPTTTAAPVNELAGRVAGKPQSCVPSSPVANLHAIDASTLAYAYGSTIYANHLGAPCPALSKFNTLIIEVQTDRYCRGDRVRGLEPGAIIAGPRCILGEWIPYNMPRP